MRNHPNPGAIVAGALFIVLGALSLLARANGTNLNVRWVWPFLLIGLGVAGLVRSRAAR
ncbi:MAG: hypothetical protein JO085_09065 [Acidimicrobiia bacterium]|nr:hypothetical protein [Acidimicrobiia bacterium]MBV8304256.1 hypothetical protein [Acidimicrobiia bacterium]MBV8559798.1 hypothetical protein [Acidimicrobiia bacterium]